MAGASFPVKRPIGRALIVGSPSARAQSLAAMQALGFACAELDDPYAATAELCRRPLVYRALILSLANLYREEMGIIATVRQRLAHVDIWLTHIEGRQGALVEAIRLGANGLLGEDGALHPFSASQQVDEVRIVEVEETDQVESGLPGDNEPVLSADELRALLQEQPPDIKS